MELPAMDMGGVSDPYVKVQFVYFISVILLSAKLFLATFKLGMGNFTFAYGFLPLFDTLILLEMRFLFQGEEYPAGYICT